ncbi:MAG: hypothetical protein R2733_25565 [Acidimicrobiales bacterium]
MDSWISGYDTNGVVFFLLVAIIPAIVAVVRRWRFPTSAFIARWFEHYDLEPTPEAVNLVTRSLARRKTIRTIGFVVAYSVPQMAWMGYTRDAHRSNELPFLTLLIAGWTLAVVVAALWPQTSPTTNASLAERRVDDYRPAFSRFDREILVAVMVLLTIASALFPGTNDGQRIDGLVALGRVVPAAAVMAVVLIAQRLVVARRQSFGSLDMVRADDALRATDVSALTGIGYGVPLLVIGTLFWQLTVVHDPAGIVMLGIVVISWVVIMVGAGALLGFGRLDNGVVIYRHRLRPASGRQPDEVVTTEVPA